MRGVVLFWRNALASLYVRPSSLLAFTLLFLLCSAISSASYAALPAPGPLPPPLLTNTPPPPPTGPFTNSLDFCTHIRNYYSTQFIYPLILCFTEPNDGLIPVLTKNFMTTTQPLYLPAVAAMATFLLAWFGLKLMYGDVRSIKSETFTILLKISGVFYFIDQAPTIYDDLLGIIAQFTSIVGTAIGSAAPPGAFCQQSDLWNTLDCVFGWALGVALVVGIGGLIAIIVLLIFSLGTAIPIVIAFITLAVNMFFTVVRFLQVYIMAIMSLSFLFVLGYLFVPLLFFRHTLGYFKQWLAMCLTYVLIPLVIYAYVAMMFVVLDQCIFTGQTSIFAEIFGDKVAAAMDPNNVTTNPLTQLQCPNTACDPQTQSCPHKYCNQDQVLAGAVGFPSHNTQIPTDVGTAGTLQDIGMTAYDFASSYSNDSMMGMTLNYNILDLNEMARDQCKNSTGCTTLKSQEDYVIDIALSFFVATLLSYIMLSLLGYLPELASSLVGQGTRAGQQVLKAETFGQEAVMTALELLKMLTSFASSGGSGGAEGAAAGKGAGLPKNVTEGTMARTPFAGNAGESRGGGKEFGKAAMEGGKSAVNLTTGVTRIAAGDGGGLKQVVEGAGQGLSAMGHAAEGGTKMAASAAGENNSGAQQAAVMLRQGAKATQAAGSAIESAGGKAGGGAGGGQGEQKAGSGQAASNQGTGGSTDTLGALNAPGKLVEGVQKLTDDGEKPKQDNQKKGNKE